MIIYKVTNKTNGMSYIGQTVYSLNTRKSKHIWDALNSVSNMYFSRALKKYGVDSFDWDIIAECGDMDELNRLEIYYIGYYNTYNNGYNLTLGGDGSVGYKFTEEVLKERSKTRKGKYIGENSPNYGKHFTEETRRKMSEAHKGQIAWNKDKTGIYSEKTKRKMSELRIELGLSKGKNNPMFGKKHTEESNRKNSEAHKDKHPTEKTRQKMSEAKKGKNNGMYGKSHTKETLQKISGKNHHYAKAVIITYPDEKEEYFYCMRDVCKKHGLNPGHLTAVAKGKLRQTKGFRCRYA